MLSGFFRTFKRKINSAFYVTLRLFNYYPFFSYLHGRGERINLTEEYELDFTEDEKAFLKACAASYNYFESDYALGHRQKELSIYKLKDVTFLSHTGAIMLQHKLIVESASSVTRLTETKAFRDFSLLFSHTYTDGVYTTIQHSHWADNNISHWLIDCLPRLYIITQLIKEPVTLLMWSGAHPYQKQMLEYLLHDYPHIKVKYISKHHKIRIANFYLPSFVAATFSAYLPPDVGQWIREKIWDGYGIERANPKKRVYISRSKATLRRILNEQELIVLLEQYGFRTVWAEDLDYKSQIQLFYDAEAVVSSHGAGLTNILFAEKCHVLEFHPAKIMKAHYMLLSKGLGFEYTPIVGSHGDESESYTVPLPEVAQWLHTNFNATS
ncbi:glycosyltransferase family 61 protein [Pontibacter sp. BT731]|uniref:glycosyltransferase family 61 protein n=1 Tax=Pontibacter coccineus TaxID=3063328 RepID=UPI0026E3D8D9|nr:glycosyltransferase family 61 protein [Pontibacter sp. BT731]MDO6389286.1 glycosyltransferase family 61 protein [Pontibacter sp. BT731]